MGKTMKPTTLIFVGLALIACKKDKDGDGYKTSIDCDDSNDLINPGANEICDGVDNDCDDEVDEDATVTYYADVDGDGYGDPDVTAEACSLPSGYVENGLDCDDSNDLYNPAASEDDCSDPEDYNCDGSSQYEDEDQDGYPACEDCDDADDTINEESIWYADDDGDGYGDNASTASACTEPTGYVDNNEDCDDSSELYNPDASEEDCTDPADYNCDGSSQYEDADSDSIPACEDCNDSDATIYPDADEICDGLDNDCDDLIDDEDDDDVVDGSTFYIDYDGDGYGALAYTEVACDAPSGFVDNAEDCDDTTALANPGETEVCDEIDNDCDGTVDGASASDAETVYYDYDGDGFGDPATEEITCTTASGYVDVAGDCDDDEDSINPDEIEVCNDGIDNNCDETADGCELDLTEADAVLLAEGAGDQLGYSLPPIHADFNQDGYDDLVLGAYNNDNSESNAGTLYILYGSVSSQTVGEAGDLIEGETSGDSFGRFAGSMGDFDNNGYDDLVVGAPNQDSGGKNAGASYIFLNAGDSDTPFADLTPADADLMVLGEGAYDYLGGVAVGVGDVNSDGYDDFLSGAKNYNVAGVTDSTYGAAYLVLGAATIAENEFDGDEGGYRLMGEGDDDALGVGMAGADINGDGVGDILLGAELNDGNGTDSGAIYVLLGPVTSERDMGADDDAQVVGASAGDRLGLAVEPAGDINEDGYDDFLTGATRDDVGAPDAGITYLVYGSSTIDEWDGAAISDSEVGVQASFYGVSDDNTTGGSMAAGDFDNDGEIDFLIGAENVGSDGEGAAYFFYGPVSGSLPLSSADASFTGDESNDQAGQDVAFAGDLDGSGNNAILVGANKDDDAGTDGGAVYIILSLDQ